MAIVALLPYLFLWRVSTSRHEHGWCEAETAMIVPSTALGAPVIVGIANDWRGRDGAQGIGWNYRASAHFAMRSPREIVPNTSSRMPPRLD
jgi:hypothetical protein